MMNFVAELQAAEVFRVIDEDGTGYLDQVLNMMNFVLKVMSFALKMMNFVLKMMSFALKMMNFVPG